MACLPQKPLSMISRIVALILAFCGLALMTFSYVSPSWTEFRHNGLTGSLGIHKMCEKEDGEMDCRDIQGKDFLFYIFQGSASIGVVAYGIFFINITMTFCSCCITSPKAVTMTKLFVVVCDLITFNCLMIAIATGLKSDFLGTVKISYGCILTITAFSIAVILCPVYLIDARNTARGFKEKAKNKYQKFTDIQEPDDKSITFNEQNGIRKRNENQNDITDDMKYNSINPST